MPIAKPLLSKIWANAAGAPDLESPDDPKYATGWVYGEKPPHKQMNWLQWTFSKALAHLNENGVLEHDLLTTYPLGAYVWKDGKVYRSRVAGNVNNAVTLPSKWQEQSLPDMPTSGDGFILYYSGSKLYWKDQRDIAYTPYQGRTASDNKSLILPNDNTTGNAPVATEINIGELAINFKDKAIYTKTPEGAIIQLGGAASIVDKEFTLTAGQTTVQPVGGYAVNQIEVFMNGRKLSKTEYVANDSVNVILNEAGSAGDLLVVSVWGAFTVADAYTQAQTDALLNGKLNKQTVSQENWVGVDIGGGEFLYPDGTIVGTKTGSTTGGTYIKYPNGEIECRHTTDTATTTSTLAAAPIHRDSITTFTFPHAFVDTPVVTPIGESVVSSVWGVVGTTLNSTQVSIVLLGYLNTAQGRSGYIAKGRYK